ncbi:MAG: fibrobacter succinogenes major paralogous domain-containing protein [Fibrobacter sp.]|nr:fibrobacter succinogenes major paralogous domain-containing protein [Fibrobacter sp.]
MNQKSLLAFAACALMFVACGDDVTEVNEIHQDGMAVLEAGLELSKQKCDSANVGEMLFVMDSSEAFICDGESWQTLKGADGKDGEDGEKGDKGAKGDKGSKGDSGDDGTSCTAEPVKNSAGLDGIEVTCGKTVVGTIWNGKPGEDGRDGEDGDDGNDGASCTAKLVENDAGFEGLEVTCGKTVVGTIWNGKPGENGKDGEDGDDGDDGTSCTATVNQDGSFDLVCGGQKVGTITNGEDGVGCTLDDEGDGKVTVSCGKGSAMTTTILYKAVCGTKPYDPAKSFCSEGELYSCDDKPYDPTMVFCSEGEVYELCGGKNYDPKTRYCLEVTRDGSDIYSVEALLTDSRDKQIYKTVKIGDQTWMAENLNYSVKPNEQSWCGGGSGTTEGECSVYGRLYTWAAAVGKSEDECGYGHECDLSDAKNEKGEVRGICPEGWHLPSNDEWPTLFTAVGGEDKAGTALKSKTGWKSQTGDAADRDAYGFSALPAGTGYGYFFGAGDSAHFWSASQSEVSSNDAYSMVLYYDREDAGLACYYKYVGYSVRCLQD